MLIAVGERVAKIEGFKISGRLACADNCIYLLKCGEYYSKGALHCTTIVHKIENLQLSRGEIDAVTIRVPSVSLIKLTLGTSYGKSGEERIIPIPGETRIIDSGNLYTPTNKRTD
jgi:hypothetical protein